MQCDSLSDCQQIQYRTLRPAICIWCLIYIFFYYLYYIVYYKLLMNIRIEVIKTIDTLRHILSLEHGEEDSRFLSNIYSRAIQLFGRSFAAVIVEWLADHTRKNHNFIISINLNNCVILLYIYIYT